MNGPIDVKAKLRMMTVDDAHFAMWREFIERHHHGELINPNMGDMYKESNLLHYQPNSSSLVNSSSILGTSPMWTSRCMSSISWAAH